MTAETATLLGLVWVHTEHTNKYLLGAAVFLAFAVFLTYVSVRYWRGSLLIPKLPPTGSTVQMRIRAAQWRIGIPGSFFCYVLSARFLVSGLGQLTSTNLQSLYTVLGVLEFVAVILILVVVAFNAPKWLIPPQGRDFGGFFSRR